MAAYFIQIATPALARHLCTIINTSIMTGVFPKLWKQAKVFPIFKGGKRFDMNNYRPIHFIHFIKGHRISCSQ